MTIEKVVSMAGRGMLRFMLTTDIVYVHSLTQSAIMRQARTEVIIYKGATDINSDDVDAVITISILHRKYYKI